MSEAFVEIFSFVQQPLPILHRCLSARRQKNVSVDDKKGSPCYRNIFWQIFFFINLKCLKTKVLDPLSAFCCVSIQFSEKVLPLLCSCRFFCCQLNKQAPFFFSRWNNKKQQSDPGPVSLIQLQPHQWCDNKLKTNKARSPALRVSRAPEKNQDKDCGKKKVLIMITPTYPAPALKAVRSERILFCLLSKLIATSFFSPDNAGAYAIKKFRFSNCRVSKGKLNCFNYSWTSLFLCLARVRWGESFSCTTLSLCDRKASFSASTALGNS